MKRAPFFQSSFSLEAKSLLRHLLQYQRGRICGRVVPLKDLQFATLFQHRIPSKGRCCRSILLLSSALRHWRQYNSKYTTAAEEIFGEAASATPMSHRLSSAVQLLHISPLALSFQHPVTKLELGLICSRSSRPKSNLLPLPACCNNSPELGAGAILLCKTNRLSVTFQLVIDRLLCKYIVTTWSGDGYPNACPHSPIFGSSMKKPRRISAKSRSLSSVSRLSYQTSSHPPAKPPTLLFSVLPWYQLLLAHGVLRTYLAGLLFVHCGRIQVIHADIASRTVVLHWWMLHVLG